MHLNLLLSLKSLLRQFQRFRESLSWKLPWKVIWSNLLPSIDYQILHALNRGENIALQQHKLQLFINFKTLKHYLKIQMRKLQLCILTHSEKQLWTWVAPLCQLKAERPPLNRLVFPQGQLILNSPKYSNLQIILKLKSFIKARNNISLFHLRDRVWE